jgi:hypothetical protein
VDVVRHSDTVPDNVHHVHCGKQSLVLIVKVNEHAVCGKCGRFCQLGAHKLHVECAGLNIFMCSWANKCESNSF